MQYHYANVGFYSHYALLHGFVNYQAKLQPQLHLKWKMMWQIFPTIYSGISVLRTILKQAISHPKRSFIIFNP